jgi:hypothetical protein
MHPSPVWIPLSADRASLMGRLSRWIPPAIFTSTASPYRRFPPRLGLTTLERRPDRIHNQTEGRWQRHRLVHLLAVLWPRAERRIPHTEPDVFGGERLRRRLFLDRDALRIRSVRSEAVLRRILLCSSAASQCARGLADSTYLGAFESESFGMDCPAITAFSGNLNYVPVRARITFGQTG